MQLYIIFSNRRGAVLPLRHPAPLNHVVASSCLDAIARDVLFVAEHHVSAERDVVVAERPGVDRHVAAVEVAHVVFAEFRDVFGVQPDVLHLDVPTDRPLEHPDVGLLAQLLKLALDVVTRFHRLSSSLALYRRCS